MTIHTRDRFGGRQQSKDGTRARQSPSWLGATRGFGRSIGRPPTAWARSPRLQGRDGEVGPVDGLRFPAPLAGVRDLFDAGSRATMWRWAAVFRGTACCCATRSRKILANRGFQLFAHRIIAISRDLTNNLKLIRRDVVDQLVLTQPGFAVNAETGLQPLLMGYMIKEVPISWINRTHDLGTSSFRLARVGGGYVQVLLHLWTKTVFGTGRYRSLIRAGDARGTWKGTGSPWPKLDGVREGRPSVGPRTGSSHDPHRGVAHGPLARGSLRGWRSC